MNNKDNIQIVPLDQPSIWHTFESIKALADKMKAESGDTDTDDIVYVDDYVPKQPEKEDLVPLKEDAKGSAVGSPDALSSANNDAGLGGSDNTSAVADEAQSDANEGESVPGDAAASPDTPDNDTAKDADGNPAPPPKIPVNKWVKVILDKMIEEYANTETMDELIFGPGLPENETKHVKVRVASLKQYFYCKKTKEGDDITVLYQKHSPEKVVEILNKSNGENGGYSFVEEDALPKYDEFIDFVRSGRNKPIRLKPGETPENLAGPDGPRRFLKRRRFRKQDILRAQHYQQQRK